MSYHRPRRRALAGTTGPSWYRAMNGVSTQLPSPRVGRPPALGSLGDDPVGATTLSTPTISDTEWQQRVLSQLEAGVAEMRRGDTFKLLQIIATLSIPLAAAAWRVIFRRGADPTV